MIPLPTHSLLITPLTAQEHMPANDQAQWIANIDMGSLTEMPVATALTGTKTSFDILIDCGSDMRCNTHGKTKQALVCSEHH